MINKQKNNKFLSSPHKIQGTIPDVFQTHEKNEIYSILM